MSQSRFIHFKGGSNYLIYTHHSSQEWLTPPPGYIHQMILLHFRPSKPGYIHQMMLHFRPSKPGYIHQMMLHFRPSFHWQSNFILTPPPPKGELTLICSRIVLICGSKPMSSMRSASSITRYVVRRRLVRPDSRKSIRRPGVAIQIWQPAKHQRSVKACSSRATGRSLVFNAPSTAKVISGRSRASTTENSSQPLSQSQIPVTESSKALRSSQHWKFGAIALQIKPKEVGSKIKDLPIES